MKHQTIDIEKINSKPTNTPLHQRTLRKHLLTSSYWNKNKTPQGIIQRYCSQVTLLLKGGEKIMQKNKILSTGIALAAVAVVIGISFMLIPQNTKAAYAEQLAQQSYQKVSNLSQQDLDALKRKLPMDPSELLQEAKTAKDLKTITYDEFSNQTPAKMGFSTNGPIPSDAPEIGTPDKLDGHTLKFLQFTDKEGNKVILGIDQNNLPVLAFSTNKDGSTFGIMHKAGTTEGPMTGSISIKGKGKDENDTKNVVFINKNDPKNLIINGKKYPVPSGELDKSTVQVKDGDVYINGVKTTPENQ